MKVWRALLVGRVGRVAEAARAGQAACLGVAPMEALDGAIGGAAGGVWPALAQAPAPKVANPRHSAGRVDFKANDSMRSR